MDLLVGIKEGILASHNIAKSKTGSQGNPSQTLWSRCASVWNFYNLPNAKIYFLYSFDHDSLSFWMDAFYLKVWAILFLSFSFLSLSLFLHALWHAFFSSHAFWHGYFSLLFFSIAHIEGLMINEWSNHLVGWKHVFA